MPRLTRVDNKTCTQRHNVIIVERNHNKVMREHCTVQPAACKIVSRKQSIVIISVGCIRPPAWQQTIGHEWSRSRGAAVRLCGCGSDQPRRRSALCLWWWLGGYRHDDVCQSLRDSFSAVTVTLPCQDDDNDVYGPGGLHTV